MAGIERYAAPDTLDEALQLRAAGEATVLGGGTDLMLHVGSANAPLKPLLLSLRRIPDLRAISRENGSIRVGSLTTVTDTLDSGLLREQAPILPATADCFAAGQVRNAATLGGNICNASPAGDMIIPLLLLDAEVELASWVDGELFRRSLPIADFFVGPGQTRMRETEILTAFRFPAPCPESMTRFRKFGTRPAMDIAVVSVGIAGVRRGSVLEDVRVALGAVAPRPLRGRKTEQRIEGQPLNDTLIAEAADCAADEISPISDVRASAWYRRELVRTLIARLLHDVAQA